MNENSDELDLVTCSRRARRWAIGLACLLAFNFSLVALALAGFGARPRPPVAGKLAAVEPLHIPQVPAHRAAPPRATASVEEPAAPPIIDRPSRPVDPTPPVEPSPPEEPPQPNAPDPPPVPPTPPTAVGPPAVAATPLAAPATESLIVINPPVTGGAVHFAIDGVVCTLAPGEYFELAGRSTRRIQYHQGDDFGYATHRLDNGTYAFGLSATGWTLKPLEPAAARKVLSACRQKAP